jgi:4-hydroxybutyrate dehydrogenase / sulfolactaldehyde 3-reductase
VATAEALVLGAKSGLSPQVMLDILRQTGANNAHLHMTYPNKALKGDFTPSFMIDLAHKDVGLALGLAGEQRIPLSVGAAAREVLSAARGKDRGKLDWTAVITVLEEIARVQVRL